MSSILLWTYSRIVVDLLWCRFCFYIDLFRATLSGLGIIIHLFLALKSVPDIILPKLRRSLLFSYTIDSFRFAISLPLYFRLILPTWLIWCIVSRTFSEGSRFNIWETFRSWRYLAIFYSLIFIGSFLISLNLTKYSGLS